MRCMLTCSWALAGSTFLACATVPSSVAPSPAVRETPYERASATLDAKEAELIAFRHDLHRHPELSGEEQRTSGKVVEALSGLGYEVRSRVGGYGVVATLRGRSERPAIAFRADMDAVRDTHPDPVAYASQTQGVRHICGHDVHTAVGIGLATSLAAIREDLPGTVVLIFQPAEEAGLGAEAMLADHVFDPLKPDAVLALHTAPMGLGTLQVMPGGMMAGRSLLRVDLTGTGDLETAASQVHAALADVATVEQAAWLTPTPAAFIAVDFLADQQTPSEGKATVSALVMSAGLENREETQRKVLAALDPLTFQNLEKAVSYEQWLEGVNNHPDVLATASNGIRAFAAGIRVEPTPGVYPMFSEDFGSFQREVPGVLYFLGVSNPDAGTVGFPHRPDYVADDAAIAIGVRAMLAAMLELMGTD